jgi:hypothetical protein
MENTRFGAIQELLERLKKSDEAIKQATAINYCAQLMEKVRSLGDVRSHFLILDQMIPLFRLLRTDRALSTVASMRQAQPLLNRMLELLKAIGNLDRVRQQVGVVEELEARFYERGDLSEFYEQLMRDDPSPKLDALKELLECLDKFQAEVLKPIR